MPILPNEIADHPILGPLRGKPLVTVTVDGRKTRLRKDEPIAAQLLARGIQVCRYTLKRKEPRGIYCAIGRCRDCVMTVDGMPNVRTCVTPVRAGMVIKTQHGIGRWEKKL